MKAAILICTFIFSLFSFVSNAQDIIFEELFIAAFECEDCSDALKIELFTNAIDYGTSHIRDLENFQNALINRGSIFIEIGDYKKAIEDLEWAISIKPDYVIRQKLGTAYLGNAQYQEALQQFNTYLDLAESDKKISLMRYVRSQTGEDDPSAQEELNEMREISNVEWNQKLKIGYNNRGITKGYLGNHKGACADFQKAYELGMNELKSFIEQNCN